MKKKENDDFDAFDRDSCYLVSSVINLAQACVVAIVYCIRGVFMIPFTDVYIAKVGMAAVVILDG
ncbi:MAG: hypothetical protein M3M87_05550 [Thermoproteota archaeon]|nr:hypothetical protein [Thermoproteota archaeon]